MCALAALLFTPYNLQLLLTAETLQTVAMIDVIAAMVFAAVDVALYTCTLLAQLTAVKNGIAGYGARPCQWS